MTYDYNIPSFILHNKSNPSYPLEPEWSLLFEYVNKMKASYLLDEHFVYWYPLKKNWVRDGELDPYRLFFMIFHSFEIYANIRLWFNLNKTRPRISLHTYISLLCSLSDDVRSIDGHLIIYNSLHISGFVWRFVWPNYQHEVCVPSHHFGSYDFIGDVKFCRWR